MSNVSVFPAIETSFVKHSKGSSTGAASGFPQTAPAGGIGRVEAALEQLAGRHYRELNVRIDRDARAIWCRLSPDGPPSFTPSMLQEMNLLHADIRALFEVADPEDPPPLLHYVQGSSIPGIYNMGGDFAFMKECVLRGDRAGLRRYAHDCVESVHRLLTGFETPLISVALVQGDALGGGLEGVVCCNVVIAERSARMGLPEILFNAFPGMGAYSILSRRLSPTQAEKMIMGGGIYTAEQMHEMGIVDILVDDGQGEAAVQDYINAGESRHRVRKAMFTMRQRVNPVPLQELYDVTDLWVDHILKISPSDMRRMGHLRAAQARRIERSKLQS